MVFAHRYFCNVSAYASLTPPGGLAYTNTKSRLETLPKVIDAYPRQGRLPSAGPPHASTIFAYAILTQEFGFQLWGKYRTFVQAMRNQLKSNKMNENDQTSTPAHRKINQYQIEW